MMRGRLFIDGNDAYTDYGVYVEDNGLCGLIQFPAFKKIDSTDWLDEDGEEYDLTAPLLDTRTFQLSFAIHNVRYAQDLFYDLSQGAYHDFHVPALGRTWKLRMTSNGAFSSFVTFGKFTLNFVDDYPTIPKGTPLEVGKSGIIQGGYELDGFDMSQFGAYILKGSLNDLRKSPQVKTNLEIKSNYITSVIYDAEVVHFKPKDVSFNLLIKTSTVAEFWERYDALFSVLLQPELHKFVYKETEAVYECFYSKQNITRFFVEDNGGIWCEFTLTLKFVSCRPATSYMFLVTQDNDYITTEDGIKVIIRPSLVQMA